MSLVDVTVAFAAVVVAFDPVERLSTWKPWMSTDDALEKRSVACPTALPEQSSVPYSNMLMFFSPCASMENTIPFLWSTVIHLEGPWPDSTCLVLLASLQVNSHAPVEGRTASAETDRGTNADHFMLEGFYWLTGRSRVCRVERRAANEEEDLSGGKRPSFTF